MTTGLANHVLTLAERVPGLVLPIVVIELLSAKANAYWYIIWMSALVVYITPQSVGIALFAEGAHRPEVMSNATAKALRVSLIFGGGCAVVLALLANPMLHLIGEGYEQAGAVPLRILLLGVIPMAFISAYYGRCRARGRLGEAIATGILGGLAGIIVTAMAGVRYGLPGMAIAWVSVLTGMSGWAAMRLWAARGERTRGSPADPGSDGAAVAPRSDPGAGGPPGAAGRCARALGVVGAGHRHPERSRPGLGDAMADVAGIWPSHLGLHRVLAVCRSCDLAAGDAAVTVSTLVIVSDLHLGGGLRAATWGDAFRDEFTDDQAFSDFLCWLTKRPPSRLVFLGDTFDFLRVPVTSTRTGLFARSDAEAVAQLDQIAAAHPTVFKALSAMLAAGVHVDFVSGNHDAELIRSAVQKRLCALLGTQVRFHPWLLYIPGLLYAEHGHHHHDINAFVCPLYPYAKSDGCLERPPAAWLGDLRRFSANPRHWWRDAMTGLRGRRPSARRRAEYFAKLVPAHADQIGLPERVVAELHDLANFSALRSAGGWSAPACDAVRAPVTCSPPLPQYAT